MTLSPDISFHNLRPSALIRDDIASRIDQLRLYCDDLISCRVVVEKPHRRHERGNRFHVAIEVAVPGAEIVVTHASALKSPAADGHDEWKKSLEVDAMRADLQLVIREAFDVARRRLKDHLRRRRAAPRAGSLSESHPRSPVPALR